VRDGGFDAVGNYLVGHAGHQVSLRAFVEAKHWKWSKTEKGNSVGVKPMSRLISRLRHHDLGVFVTTSVFDSTVQEELLEDAHPIILLSGGDLARLLISKDLVGDKLEHWMASVRTAASAVTS
jgi:restriction endonuclease Mrr